MSDTIPARKLYTVRQWAEQHGWPSEGGLRHLIFHAATNGFDKVIRRAGRRILLDEHEFNRWIDNGGSTGAPAAARKGTARTRPTLGSSPTAQVKPGSRDRKASNEHRA